MKSELSAGSRSDARIADRSETACSHCSDRSRVSRRGFLTLGAVTMAAPVLAGARQAAATRAMPGGIDIHAHYFPMEYLRSIAEKGGVEGFTVDLSAAAGPTLTGGGAVTVLDPTYWDLEKRVAAMDAVGVAMHALSLTMPMPHLAAPPRAAELARIFNDASIAAHAKYPGRFVGCVTLPLNDPAASVTELDRVATQKGMRAVYFPTNVAGKELSDRSFFAVYEKIEQLKLPIMLHPHPPVVGLNRMREYYLPNLLGNPFDTTIAASHLVFGGVMDRFPRLEFLLPHAGGTFPFLYGRLQRGQSVIPNLKGAIEHPVSDYLKRFYYDTITHSPEALAYLVDLVGADRVLLGSDYCFNMGYDRPRDIVAKLAIQPADRDRILNANARELLRIA